MRILLSSHLFYPSLGGLEEVSLILAEEFHRGGDEVRVVTQVTDPEHRALPFPVIRRPSISRLLGTVRWCEVLFHNNISLRTAWPLLGIRRPWVVAHHIWITRSHGRVSWQDRLKRSVLRFATNISASSAIAQALPVRSVVIGNPYRDDLFREVPGCSRDRDLVFVGRLVSDKGVDILIRALGRLKADGLRAQATIVGNGPEFESLKRLVTESHVTDQVQFAGVRQGEELVELLNRHRLLVVPSRWAEPFGLVALEGIACGCVIVGSDQGGLPEAIGPCGTTFANGDTAGLAARLGALLADPESLRPYRTSASKHLARHRRAAVAQQYLGVLQQARRGTRA